MAGITFWRKYDETVGWIAWNPDLFPKKLGTVQRVVLKHSYYIIYFVQESERSVVLAVLDGRDNPTARKKLIGRRQRVRKRTS